MQMPQVDGVESGASQASNVLTDLTQFDKDVIFNGLKRMYRKKILPLELASKYGHFHSPVSLHIASFVFCICVNQIVM